MQAKRITIDKKYWPIDNEDGLKFLCEKTREISKVKTYLAINVNNSAHKVIDRLV